MADNSKGGTGNRGKGFTRVFKRRRKPKGDQPTLFDLVPPAAPGTVTVLASELPPLPPDPPGTVLVSLHGVTPGMAEAVAEELRQANERTQERRDDQATSDVRTRVARNTSGKEKPDLAALWKAYHKRNPQVWVAFEKYTLEAITAGHLKHFGFQMVIERLRWQTAVTGDDAYKLNNNHGPYYARLFAYHHPEHAQVFRTRLSGADEVDFSAL